MSVNLMENRRTQLGGDYPTEWALYEPKEEEQTERRVAPAEKDEIVQKDKLPSENFAYAARGV